jgi:tetratricopeptide (TPR) repeat protein
MATIILGEDEQAVATLQQALELARTRELTDLAALAQITLAFPLLRQGRWDKAWEQLQQGHQTCIESQLAYLLPSALYWQAELARLEGRYEAGLALVEQALAVAHQGNFLQEEGIAWSIKGKLLDDMAHFAEAERAHRQSLAKLAEQDRYELARATLALGQHFIHKTGCPPHEAKSLLQEALAIFEQLGAGKDADLAKSLLL